METQAVSLQCPLCRKTYRIPSEYQGKAVRCRCGALMAVASSIPTSSSSAVMAEVGEYELAESPESSESDKTPSATAPQQAESSRQTWPLAMRHRAGGALNSQTLKQQEAQAIRQEKIKGFYAPLAMMAVGLPATCWVNWQKAFIAADVMIGWKGGTPTPGDILRYASMGTIFFLVVNIPCQFIAMSCTSKCLGAEFGDLIPAAMKLVAIAMFTAGIVGAVRVLLVWLSFGISEWMLGPILGYACYWGLLAWLFELDALESLVLYLIGSVLPVLVVMTLFALWRSF